MYKNKYYEVWKCLIKYLFLMEFVNVCNVKNIIEKILWDLIWFVIFLLESCVCIVFFVVFNIFVIVK